MLTSDTAYLYASRTRAKELDHPLLVCPGSAALLLDALTLNAELRNIPRAYKM